MMKRLTLYLGILIAGLAMGAWTLSGDGENRSPIWDYMPRSFEVVFGAKLVKSFEMVNHLSQTVTHETYAGKYMLTFFGYTYCPDVCPTGLNDISQVLDMLGPKATSLVPIFVSVDPERDTPEHLNDYLESFHPKFVGLTGSKRQIAAMAKNYKARYLKMKDDDNDLESYFMGHTSTVFFTDPDHQILASFNRNVTPEEMAKRVGSLLAR